MKGIILVVIILFGVAILMAVTNPGTDEFWNWYSVNYEGPMRLELQRQIDDSLKTNNATLQILIDGAYQLFAKDKTDEMINSYIASCKDKVTINRTLFVTYCTIPLPDGTVVNVSGYLNSFRVIS